MSSSEKAKEITTSPCNKVCKIDHNNICLGCFRTLEEIGKWSIISAAEKARINSSVTQRKISYKTRH